MSVSIIEAQRRLLLDTIRGTAGGDWKVLVLDHDSKRLLDSVLDQDAILNENITHIEQIEQRRPTNKDMDAVYLLSPQPHIVDCLMADFEKRKYRKAHLVWTALLHPALRERIDTNGTARSQIALFKVLNIEFYSRESHLVTFRDPWSFPVFYHPQCSNLVRQHMEDVAQKIVGVCVALGEYPVIRYYKSRTARHDARVLCEHLARFVQDELDLYAKFHEDFPPQVSRPRGSLYIVDRSMDLFAPLLHEFTYQAMAHDLLPIKEGDRITYNTLVNEGQRDQQTKDVEISEKDKIWIDNRHRHMKDTIEKLMSDFQKFMDENPNFTRKDGENANSLNAIKDMMAGLPQFQEMKEAYALHLSMAQESMNRFQKLKLPDVASVEQILATGLDEDYKKPKGLADQLVRMLDEEAVIPPDRMRLLTLYLLYKDGLLPADVQKLAAHANLPDQTLQSLYNLDILGANIVRGLKDARPPPPPLFPLKPPPPPGAAAEEYALSRFEPSLQKLLEGHATNFLDPSTFPYTKPPLDLGDEYPTGPQSTSLRNNKPTWAKTRTNVSTENRQRVIVFMAGGATYSESRACYETTRTSNREVFLATSHMLTPSLFLRQLGDLSADRRRLGIPSEQPKPQAPAHLFEPDEQPRPSPQQQQQARPSEPPTKQMAGLGVGGGGGGPGGPRPPPPSSTSAPVVANSSAKLKKEAAPPEKEKKKRHFFGSSKKDKG
ncbi:hypothetical protein MBLNU230_g1694t1 [Neophaeotheca triangularis]